MNQILSYAIPKDSSNIILCGYGYVDPATFLEEDAFFNTYQGGMGKDEGYKATILMMSSDGKVQWKV